MIIEPQGMLNGDRIGSCADLSKLWWPFFLAISNTMGRLEINTKLIRSKLTSFNNPPSEEQIFFYLKDYQNNYLLFVYQVDGKLWGQWDIPAHLLNRHKLAADKRTPAPEKQAWDAWKAEYLKIKEERAKSISCSLEIISSNPERSCAFESVPAQLGVFEKNVRGVGVGVGSGNGVGKGKDQNPSDAAKAPRGGNRKMHDATGETRHARIKSMIQTAYRERNEGSECPWDAADNTQLSRFLKRTPNWPDSQIAQCLDHRYRSDGIDPGEDPFRWIMKLPSYLKGPKDKFGNLVEENKNAKPDTETARKQQAERLLAALGSAGPGRESSGAASDHPDSSPGMGET